MAGQYGPVNPNQFAKCAPAISTNIKQCGTVTVCNAKPTELSELDTLFKTDEGSGTNDFRVMEALFHHDFEIKMCEAVQNGLYDFFMANKVPLTKKMSTRRLNAGELEIEPFVMARQYSPINNEYFALSSVSGTGGNGPNTGTAYTISARATSTTNIPMGGGAAAQMFPVGLRVFVMGRAANGVATRTAWIVVDMAYTAGNTYCTLYLKSANYNSGLNPNFDDKLAYPASGGILTRGTPNVSDYEKWCNESATFLNWKNVPFWVESTRDSLCRSELYAKARKLLLTNPLYREFYDLPETEKNKQIAADFQKRCVQQMFWGKASDPNQNLNSYRSLPEIDVPLLEPLFSANNQGIGAEGGRCVGKKADMIGIYEQHASCGRVLDLLQQKLSIPSLAKALYNMWRVRLANGKKNAHIFDCFCDSQFAEMFNTAMLQYYQAKSQNMARLNLDAEGTIPRLSGEGRVMPKEAQFGFYYTTWRLFWPQGIVINIITHTAFDDLLTAAAIADTSDTNLQDAVRMFWILDFSGIYPGIIATNRVVNKTGDIKTMSAISSQAACVMKTPSVEWTHYSMMYTMVCECTMGNLIIENIGNITPDYANSGGDYDAMAGGAGTTTTTLTAEIGVTSGT